MSTSRKNGRGESGDYIWRKPTEIQMQLCLEMVTSDWGASCEMIKVCLLVLDVAEFLEHGRQGRQKLEVCRQL